VITPMSTDYREQPMIKNHANFVLELADVALSPLQETHKLTESATTVLV
jgi:hypothetical protein